MTELSTISEIAISYALLTVGRNPDESKIMRLRAADAARELGQNITADEIEKSLTGHGTSRWDEMARAVQKGKGANV